VVGWIDGEFIAGIVVMEELRLDVEVLEAEDRVGCLVDREKESQTMDGGLAAEVVEPDERVCQRGVGVSWRGSECGQTPIASDEQAPWTGRREGMFQVGAGGEFSDAPAGKLAGKPTAELFPEDFARRPEKRDGSLRPGLVHQCDGGRFASELFDGDPEASRGMGRDRDNAAGECTGLVPGLEEKPIGSISQRISVREERQRRVAGF